MRSKRLTLAAGVCFALIIIVVVVVRLGPPPKRVLDSALVTYDCTDVVATSLRARADIIDDGGDWVTRRGFQYSEGDSGNLTDIISLANAGFEYGDPPDGWTDPYEAITFARSTEQVKTGTYSAKLSTPDGAWRHIRYTALNEDDFKGKTVTFGVWAYVPSSNQGTQLIAIHCGADMFKLMNLSKSDEWTWYTVAYTVPEEATHLRLLLYIAGSTYHADDVVYFDGVFLAEGSDLEAIFEDGEFGTGTYSSTIAGLKPDTSYRVRAFAENEGGVEYGNMVICKTQE